MKYPKLHRAYAIAITLIVAVSVAAGLFVAGSPTKERLRRLDEQRVQSLEQIRSIVNDHAARLNTLPASLSDTSGSLYIDPRILGGIEYRVLSTSTYELCATFETDGPQEPYAYPYPKRVENAPFWKHGVGRVCFSLTK
ncbi:MAG: hypothetical protein Q8R07_00900 [Candidatus Uhrbacteria bacterium]|nr:hypothetical protein [Candidatus Uhrbacteria bacterium]